MVKGKKTFILTLLSLLVLFLFTGCKTLEFTVTYKNGNEVIESVNVKNNELASDKLISDEVHEFLGWTDNSGAFFDFNTPITNNITLYAKWTNTVKFVNYDGRILEEIEVKEGEEFEGPSKNPIKPSDEEYDYHFSGWNQPLVGIGYDMQIEATYTKTKITYLVTYYDDNNNVIDTKNVIKGEKCENLVAANKSDDRFEYVFSGWVDLAGNDFNFDNIITQDIKLIAKYTKQVKARESLEGMKVSMMGASISTFYASKSEMNSYYSGNDEFYYPKYSGTVTTVKYTWWYKMIKELGLELGINNSLSGSAVTVGAADRQARSYERIRAMGENGTPDIIILFIGINDNVSGVSNENFEKGYKEMIERTIEVYPNAYIFLGTFYYSHYHVREKSHSYYNEESRLAYNDIIRKLANEYQTGLVELADIWEAGVSPTQGDAGSLGYLGDNLHPSKKGMEVIANKFIADIKTYFGME